MIEVGADSDVWGRLVTEAQSLDGGNVDRGLHSLLRDASKTQVDDPGCDAEKSEQQEGGLHEDRPRSRSFRS
jgi:hypothetical protein